MYHQARSLTHSEQNILSGFQATGLKLKSRKLLPRMEPCYYCAVYQFCVYRKYILSIHIDDILNFAHRPRMSLPLVYWIFVLHH